MKWIKVSQGRMINLALIARIDYQVLDPSDGAKAALIFHHWPPIKLGIYECTATIVTGDEATALRASLSTFLDVLETEQA